MSNPTSNFGWQMPTPTDLVTDLPADFEVFGQAVDTSLADLKGGTTGQILSKATNADMDFTWTTANPGDITEVTAGTGITGGGTSGAVTITNDMATTITAAGDIVVGTGSGTYDNLPIGTTNQVLTADTTVSPYKVKWATPAAAGGLDLISTTSFSATASVSVSSCFSSTYDNYMIKLNSTTVATANSSLALRLRVGGTDTNTNYKLQYIAANGTGISAARFTTETAMHGIGYLQPAFNNEFTLNIANPFNTQITTAFTNQIQAGGGNIEMFIAAFGLNDTTSYPGFTIISPNNMTGSVSVYGYKK